MPLPDERLERFRFQPRLRFCPDSGFGNFGTAPTAKEPLRLHKFFFNAT